VLEPVHEGKQKILMTKWANRTKDTARIGKPTETMNELKSRSKADQDQME